MTISVVIATCNRKSRLLSLIDNLNRSSHHIMEVIIVDSGEQLLCQEEYAFAGNLRFQYLRSEKSVCIQRNLGIENASGAWVFICDDDIEVPADYLEKLTDYIGRHPETGAISGLVLQQEKNQWTAQYPEHSAKALVWKYIFQLSIWGPIDCKKNNFLVRRISNYYRQKGNHISRAGWPVITDFGGEDFTSPVYGLGASLIKKEWLGRKPFDEVLDRHGIGDNYGAAMDFPENIRILNNAFVYHHRDPSNRLDRPLQYLRRVLALDYFIRSKTKLQDIRRTRLIWSLTGSLIAFTLSGDFSMSRAASSSILKILTNRNPYLIAYKKKVKTVEPGL
jgi:glycosyltransferase involved in cell wall biosynthesis